MPCAGFLDALRGFSFDAGFLDALRELVLDALRGFSPVLPWLQIVGLSGVIWRVFPPH
jgi:hypothetical protein|tara:strand:- start:838 stop:1011 length:174 start_codon:yes stop_codon:yes gene_type:complete